MGIISPIDFTGRKILITGASSGIGRATAVYFSKLGASLVITGRDENRLQETLRQMDGQGHLVFPFDLAEQDDYAPLFDAAVADGIKLDGLVHSAGITYIMPLKSLTKKRLHEVMNVNFYSFVELARNYAKNKYAAGGSIVGMSAAMLLKPRAYELGYMASKAALEMSVRVLAHELSDRGIRVNAVMPGNVRTPMMEKVLDEYGTWEKTNAGVEKTLIHRWETPEDIAGCCAFLMSDMAGIITGRILYADGGVI